MTNISMLAVCLLAGVLLRVARRVPENAHAALNGFIIHVALPALILAQIHGLRLTTNLLWPVRCLGCCSRSAPRPLSWSPGSCGCPAPPPARSS